MRLRDLQEKLPWRSTYSEAFERGPAHRHFGHALHHVAIAHGELCRLQDALDHGTIIPSPSGKYVADLVILAVRIANEFPGGKLDLEAAVSNRIAEKNGVVLAAPDCDGRHVCPDCREWCRSLDAHICGQTR